MIAVKLIKNKLIAPNLNPDIIEENRQRNRKKMSKKEPI